MTNTRQDKPASFISLLQQTYSRLKLKRKLFLVITGLAVMLAGFTVLVLAESYWYLPPAVKISWMVFTLSTAILFSIRLGIRERLSTFKSFYQQFSDTTNLPNLKYSLDLYLYSKSDKTRFTETAIQKNLETIDEIAVRNKIRDYTAVRPETRFLQYAGGFLAIALLGILVSGFTLTDAFKRSLASWKAFNPPNPYTFTIEPGNLTLEQGGTLTPTIQFSNAFPEVIRLGVKTNIEKEYRYRPAENISNQKVTFAPIQLNTDATWFIEMDGFRSQVFTADVQLRPRFEALSLVVHPPTYTGLDSTRYNYPFSTVRAYQGSRIEVNGTSNKSLAGLTLHRSAYPDTNLTAPGNRRRYEFRFEVIRRDTLYFSMHDSAGLTNNNSFQAVVEPVNDERPFVQILQPDSDREIKNPGSLNLRYEASDDFGLRSASLHYRHQRAFTETADEQSVSLKRPTINAPQSYSWDLSKLELKPRDVITYWIKVRDNDSYNGAKTGVSRKLKVTVPSLTTYLDEIQDQEKEVTESLEEVSKSYEQIKKDYDRLKEQLKENPQTNWEQRQTVDKIKKKQEEMQQQVEELNKKFEEIRRQINQSQMMSQETLKAYDELEKLMDEIDDPAFREAIEELQKALDSMSQRQLREALENFEFNEQTYRERLNRTIQLFKTLKMNSQLEKMATAFEDLARQEGELSDSEKLSDESLKKQQAVREDTKKLDEQVDSLANDPPDRAREDIERLQQETKAQMENLEQQLGENLENMQEALQQDSSGTVPNSSGMQQEMQQMQRQFQMMAGQARSAQQSLNQQRNRINIAALQYILVSLINLSENQEELTRQTERLTTRSQAFVEQAREQKNIKEQFTQLSDSLYKVSTKIPTLSNRINEKKTITSRQLDNAVEQLSERSKNNSTTAQRQVLGSFNELASMISNLLETLMSQQMGGIAGSGNMRQLLEQMSGQQQQLNQQIQNLINDIQGDRLTRDQIERVNQLARQQRRIRKDLRELQQSGQLESGDRILSELERMSREMEDAINDLRGGQLDRNTVERQQNILSRMLSAEQALQERDKKDERQATTARDTVRQVPPEITLEELQKKIRAILNDPEKTKFTEDYQRLIEEYFRLLREIRDGK